MNSESIAGTWGDIAPYVVCVSAIVAAFAVRRPRKAAAPPRLLRLHTEARSQSNPNYPQRAAIPDAKVPWQVSWEDYKPVAFTMEKVFANAIDAPCPPSKRYADSATTSTEAFHAEMRNRVSYEGDIKFSKEGLPLNPVGRTGVSGRGSLGKWGPNHAADPIVTRIDSSSGKLQVVCIKRRDTGLWALPGGMVDAGEQVSQTVRREFTEETGAHLSEDSRSRFTELIDELFAEGTTVYRGYVDDPRNTDHAWMETTAVHFHCSAELGKQITLAAGDDATAVTWLDVSDDEKRYVNLYASHRDWIEFVSKGLKPRAPLGASMQLLPAVAGGSLLLVAAAVLLGVERD